MPYVAGDLVDLVLQRVHDAGATGNSRAFVRSVLTHTQRLVNAKYGLVIAETAMATVAYQQVYRVSLDTVVPAALRVVGVRQEGRDLTEVKWREFWYLRRRWARDVGAVHANFAMVGRDMLIVYPALRVSGSVTLIVATLTDELGGDGTDIQIADDYVPLMVDLATAVVLVKMRRYAPLDALTESIKARMTPVAAT